MVGASVIHEVDLTSRRIQIRKPIGRLASRKIPDGAGGAGLKSSLGKQSRGTGMKHWAMGAVALLALAGCHQQQSVSGTYLARFTNGAAQMQLTETQGGQVTGSLTVVVVNPDGKAERKDLSIISGAADANGQSLVLTVKPNELLSHAQNVAGQISRGAIDMRAPWGNSHFIHERPGEFVAAVNVLVSAGKQRAEAQATARQLDTDTRRVASLTQALMSYNDRIEAQSNGPAIPRGQEKQLLDAAQKDVEILKDLQSQNKEIAANQVRFRISQLSFQMGQIKFQVDQALQQGRDHIGGFDQALANSPCVSNVNIDGCKALGVQKVRYAKVRTEVHGWWAELSEDMQKNGKAMEAINKQAGN